MAKRSSVWNLKMLEVRRDILESFGLERRELRAMFYEDVMEQAFEVGRQAVVVNDPIAELAFKLDRFAENFDPYEYMDQVDDVQAHIQEIKADLAAGNTAPYREFLNTYTDENGNKRQKWETFETNSSMLIVSSLIAGGLFWVLLLRSGTLKKAAIKIFTRTITANIMATIFQIRRERRFLIASCSFILDSCSATSLATFSFSIFVPSNSLTDTSNISARRIRVSASGTDKFFSYLEIVCLTT